MSYIVKVIAKIILLPVVVLMLIPAYALFVISPDFNKFKFEMER